MQFIPGDPLNQEERDYVCVIFAIDSGNNDSGRVISNKVTTSATLDPLPAPDFTVSVTSDGNFLMATIEDGDPSVLYIFRWFHNFSERRGDLGIVGEQLDGFTNRLSLDDVNVDIRNGDVWYARVVGQIQDSTDPNITIMSNPVFSSSVTIGGGSSNTSAPPAPTVRIEPGNPRADLDDIRCLASGSNDDEGNPNILSVRWFEFDPDSETNESSPLLDSSQSQFTTPTLISLDTANLAERTVFCEVVAVDSFGRISPTVRSANVTITASGGGGGSSGDSFEPDDSSFEAHRIALNATAQSHTLELEDEDWLKFTLTEPSSVIIATGSSESSIEQLLQSNDNGGDEGIDTFMELFSEGDLGDPFMENDDSGNFGSDNFTLSAKIGHPNTLTLNPGTYYIRITASNPLDANGENYSVLVKSTLVAGIIVSTPNKPSIKPSEPVVTDDLIANVTGVEAGVTLHYRWFVNGFEAPVLDSNVLSSIRTTGGQQWQVAVFAENSAGTLSSTSELSDPVTVTSLIWNLEITTTKFFQGDSPTIQPVSIGWQHGATHGFDEDIDVDLPDVFIPDDNTPPPPGGLNLPSGSFASQGLDSDHPLLTTDIRPFGSDTSWFLMVDFDDASTPSRAQLEWGSVQLPVQKPLRIVEVEPLNNYSPIVSTSTDMLTENILEIDESELSGRKVFLITLGSVSESKTLTMVEGWNLVSLPVTPINPTPEAVFSNNTGKVYSGVIWGFGLLTENQTVPSYFEVKEVKAGEGYWVFVNRPGEVEVAINGSTVGNSLSLTREWNLIGPPTVRNILIPKSIQEQFETLQFQPVQFWDPLEGVDGAYMPDQADDPLTFMEVLRGYWLYSPKKQVISFEPAP